MIKIKVEKGATRIVFIFKNFVIKIPTFKQYNLFLNGILANLTERKMNSLHPDLAKVIYSNKFGLYLIMERAKVISNDINWLEFKDKLEFKYQNDELKEFLLSDCKPSNWGYINNKLVKIDYA